MVVSSTPFKGGRTELPGLKFGVYRERAFTGFERIQWQTLSQEFYQRTPGARQVMISYPCIAYEQAGKCGRRYDSSSHRTPLQWFWSKKALAFYPQQKPRVRSFEDSVIRYDKASSLCFMSESPNAPTFCMTIWPLGSIKNVVGVSCTLPKAWANSPLGSKVTL